MSAESTASFQIDPERQARRRTFMLLATAALLSGLTGLLFVVIWNNYVEGLEPEYFREQGTSWGLDFQRRIQENTNRYMTSAKPDEIEYWRENLDKESFRYFEQEFRRSPALRPRQISLLFQGNGQDAPFETAMRIGRDLEDPPPNSSFRHDPDSGLDLAVASGDSVVVVVVEGPVKNVGAAIGDKLRFHLVLEFQPFHLVTGRGTTYAVVLVIIYLGVIYFLFILVFRLGRRQMTLALSAQEKSIRLKAISSVAEGIAHEVRNPLNAISLNVQYLEKLVSRPGHEPRSSDYQRVYRELGKIRKVIDNFVNFAKSKDLEISRWALADVMDDCLRVLEPKFAESGIRVERQVEGDTVLSGDRPKITKVLQHLLENAGDAVESASSKMIDIEINGTTETVTAAIRNHGETPDEEVMKNMFDPYFTTRSSSLGLGLTLAKTVVESHGGRIRATAAPGGGLLVTVTLPREF